MLKYFYERFTLADTWPVLGPLTHFIRKEFADFPQSQRDSYIEGMIKALALTLTAMIIVKQRNRRIDLIRILFYFSFFEFFF